MVSQKEKKRMMQFVADRIEQRGKSNILRAEPKYIIIQQKPEFVEENKLPAQVYIRLHNNKNLSKAGYNAIVKENKNLGRYTANIFYKDYSTFFVRLGERGNFKGDNRSLKNYSDEEINRMIDLRGLEKIILSSQKQDHILVYFQPETTMLREALIGYEMQNVIPDYTHIEPPQCSRDADPKAWFIYERQTESDQLIAVKLTEEIFRLCKGELKFRACKGNSSLIIPNSDKQDEKYKKKAAKQRRFLF